MIVLNVEPVLNRTEMHVAAYKVKLRLTPEEFHKLMGLGWLKGAGEEAAGEAEAGEAEAGEAEAAERK